MPIGRIAILIVMLLTIVIGVMFAPIQVGGKSIYVVVNGNSMEPLYYRGDLVIVEAASDFRVGEIVTYQHPDIGMVIHRIIGRTPDGRWIFQGDNNNFIDPYEPSTDELLGRSVLHIPRAGAALMFIRQSPIIFTALLMAVPLIATTGAFFGKQRRNGRKRPAATTASATNSWRETTLAIIALVAMAAATLTGFAYTRQPTAMLNADVAYTQRGVFGYSAPAAPGIYDGEAAETGDPIFRRVSQRIQITFDYALESSETPDIAGSYAMLAEISLNNGWQRVITMVPAQEFSGAHIAMSGELDLDEVNAIVARFAEQTEIDVRQFSITIIPQVQISGVLADRVLEDQFAPRLRFIADPLQLTLVTDDGPDGKPLQPMRNGMLPRSITTTERLSLGGISLDVEAARQIGLIGLLLCILAAALVGVPLVRDAARDEATRIRLQYGMLIVEAQPGTAINTPYTILVATIADLAKLAERLGVVIVHETQPHARYVVYTDTLAYVYRGVGEQGMPERHAAPEMTVEAALAVLPDWESRFLTVLREKGIASEACRAVGISLEQAYRERAASATFAQAWAAARAEYMHQLKGGMP
ncbi:MAG TPA: signal peptidase I [Roseiflexaceae bacterium]|nr:signal peptidase I [Roseiflexaceae bacterium]HMP38870.1 signal peptidase I [Roseiflexaceae bacterium]